MQKNIEWYGPAILELLRANFAPGAKYMNEPLIGRYVPCDCSKCRAFVKPGGKNEQTFIYNPES